MKWASEERQPGCRCCAVHVQLSDNCCMHSFKIFLPSCGSSLALRFIGPYHMEEQVCQNKLPKCTLQKIWGIYSITQSSIKSSPVTDQNETYNRKTLNFCLQTSQFSLRHNADLKWWLHWVSSRRTFCEAHDYEFWTDLRYHNFCCCKY